MVLVVSRFCVSVCVCFIAAFCIVCLSACSFSCCCVFAANVANSFFIFSVSSSCFLKHLSCLLGEVGVCSSASTADFASSLCGCPFDVIFSVNVHSAYQNNVSLSVFIQWLSRLRLRLCQTVACFGIFFLFLSSPFLLRDMGGFLGFSRIFRGFYLFSLLILSVFLFLLVLWWLLPRVVLRFVFCFLLCVCVVRCFVFCVVTLMFWWALFVPFLLINCICFVWRKCWAPNL
jgi:hypothetical protein